MNSGIYLVCTMHIHDILQYNVHDIYHTYTWHIHVINHTYTYIYHTYTIHIYIIYMTYGINIHDIFMTYTIHTHDIYMTYTLHIHSILWVYSAPGGWCCGGGQGPIPPDPPAITSPGRVITLILLHSNAHFGFLLLCMWIRRARLELKIAGKCCDWHSKHTNHSSSTSVISSPKMWQEQAKWHLKAKAAGTENEMSFK